MKALFIDTTAIYCPEFPGRLFQLLTLQTLSHVAFNPSHQSTHLNLDKFNQALHKGVFKTGKLHCLPYLEGVIVLVAVMLNDLTNQ